MSDNNSKNSSGNQKEEKEDSGKGEPQVAIKKKGPAKGKNRAYRKKNADEISTQSSPGEEDDKSLQ